MIARRLRVCIAQHRLLHYRIELFERLRASCAQADIELQLVHGQATAAEASRRDTGTLSWALPVNNRVLNLRGRDVLWQPLPAAAQGCDLLVLMQENRLFSNYPWLFGWRSATTRLAFWGHGRNFQSSAPGGLRERWKRLTLTRVDWWFAYTALSQQAVLQAGYPVERVTVLNNAIDNTRFAQELALVTDDQVASLRKQVGATRDSVLGLYCGSLYPDKRLEMLLEAGQRIANVRPEFRLVVVGDGPSRALLERAAHRPWLHWAGVQRGLAKAAWFRAAQLYLSPGAVGLHVLDSFVAGLPMVTTNDALHGPEMTYLRDGENGLICAGQAAAFADAVLGLIARPDQAQRLRQAALASAPLYTLDEMVRRFTEGMLGCLHAPRLNR